MSIAVIFPKQTSIVETHRRRAEKDRPLGVRMRICKALTHCLEMHTINSKPLEGCLH
jgi:hypothetical protein